MSPLEAEKIIKRYGDAMARQPKGHTARKRSWLPAEPYLILLAGKIVLGFLAEKNLLDAETVSFMSNTLIWLPTFVIDDIADHVNLSNDDSPIRDAFRSLFVECVPGGARWEEIVAFVNNLEKLDRSDPLYSHRIRALVGTDF